VSGCYRGPGTDSPVESQGAPVLPWGVLATPAQRTHPNVGGIYPGSRHDSCCSAGQEMTIVTNAPLRPRHLYIDLYFPDFTAMYGLRHRPQNVTVSFGPHRESVRVDQPGVRELKFHIPNDARVTAGTIRFGVHMSYAVVPKKMSSSPDWRPFSVVLLGVDVD